MMSPTSELLTPSQGYAIQQTDNGNLATKEQQSDNSGPQNTMVQNEDDIRPVRGLKVRR